MTAPSPSEGRRYWLDDAKNVRRLVSVLIGLSLLAFLASALYVSHGFPIESVFGFHGVYGFVACVALVMIAKAMRRVLMRRESYYQDDRY